MSDLNRTNSGLDPKHKLKLLRDLRDLLAQLWKRIGVKTENDWEAALAPHNSRIAGLALELGLCGQHQFDFPPVGIEGVEGPDFGQMKITYLKYKDPLSGNSSKQLIRAFERSPEFPNERVWNMKINQGREVRDWCLVLLESWDSCLSGLIADLQAEALLSRDAGNHLSSAKPIFDEARIDAESVVDVKPTVRGPEGMDLSKSPKKSNAGRKPAKETKEERRVRVAWATGQYNSTADVDQTFGYDEGTAKKILERIKKRESRRTK